MQEDSIFLIKDSGDLEKVQKRPYENEDILQVLIEKYPDLLAGDQINRDNPTRFILIKREAGIPDEEQGSDRWSVDHLLLDQDAIPTFVETKRSSDSRIRREIVGQMLDYAANSLKYWPVDRIRTMAIAQFGNPENLDSAIISLLDQDPEGGKLNIVEDYWIKVEDNLRNGRLRLLFVADSLPRELIRIIEFLNEQMTKIEVLGVELAQFVGSDFKAIVPRVYGQTEIIRQSKQALRTRGPRITLKDFTEQCPEYLKEFFEELVSSAVAKGMEIYWGRKGFSLRVQDKTDNMVTLFYCFPPGTNDRDITHIQGYVGGIADETTRNQIYTNFLSVKGTTAQGKYTANLNLTSDNMDAAKDLLQITWEASDMLSRPK